MLIFDASNQELLQKYLCPWNPEVLHLRGEQINILVLLASLFRKDRGSQAYIDCFIERVRPRLIVTFIDNYIGFYSVAIRHKNVKTIFVQNGIRGPEIFEQLDRARQSQYSLKVDYMLTFGSRIGIEYAKYLQGTVVPMGSIKNNMIPRCQAKRVGTIAFVSQYMNTDGFMWGGTYRTRQEFYEQADKLVLGFLVKYAKKHGKELFIIPCRAYCRDNTLDMETAYYNQLLGQSCYFSEWHWHGSSYESVDIAEVVVSIDSTLGYESASRGNKTAIFSIRTQILSAPGRNYGWPGVYRDEGPFWTNRPDPAIFERVLDHLFSMQEEQWRVLLDREGFSNIMAYDPDNSIFKSILRKELAPEPGVIH